MVPKMITRRSFPVGPPAGTQGTQIFSQIAPGRAGRPGQQVHRPAVEYADVLRFAGITPTPVPVPVPMIGIGSPAEDIQVASGHIWAPYRIARTP
ncbi:hypothetical protein GCM10022384_56010 [Streptomyces marokkonensis]|uniref:Uncharacterized protein n=1 Tax=Streptomyces marokkonensis TaxID=324855 RepID=A0ABP7RTH5_9ACTN